jgi:hypothetical protein
VESKPTETQAPSGAGGNDVPGAPPPLPPPQMPQTTTSARPNVPPNIVLPWAVAVGAIALAIYVYSDSSSKIASQSYRISELTSQLSEANEGRRAAERKTQEVIEEAKRAVAVASIPPSTISVQWRKGFIDNGHVAVIRNMSSSATEVTLTFARPGSDKSKRYSITIDGGSTREIGESEGWAVLPDDTLEIDQPRHKPKSITFR